MHAPDGVVEIECDEFKRVESSTITDEELIRVLAADQELFSLKRFGQEVRVFGTDIIQAVPCDAKYHDKGVLVQCGDDEPRINIADPKKLGVPTDGSPRSLIVVSWVTTMPITTTAVEIVRLAAEKRAAAEAARRKLVPVVEDDGSNHPQL